jgi:hypothetical protein
MRHHGLLVLICCSLSSVPPSAVASTEFSTIVGKNVFRLSPPKPERNAEVKPELPVVSLQGLSMLLNSRQALLGIQTSRKAAGPGINCVLSEAQEQNGVRILRIDTQTATVWLTNQGVEQILSLKR